jgi:hypothetical protein
LRLGHGPALALFSAAKLKRPFTVTTEKINFTLQTMHFPVYLPPMPISLTYPEGGRKHNMSAAPEAINAAINARNTANAQFSTGPTSSTGKDRVKFNALKTGLFARTIVLPGEQQSDYEALGAHLTSEWVPQSDAEREIVLTIQSTMWRLSRAVEMESALFAIVAQQKLESIAEQFGHLDSNAQYALARAAGYMANARAFDQLNRQEGRLERALAKAKRELKALMVSRVPSPVPPLETACQAEMPAEEPPPAAVQPNPTGFVPRKYPKHMPTFTGPNAKTYRSMWLQKNGFANLA